MPRLGLISDTHGYLDPGVHEWLRGVDQIVHAGDVGPARILFELEAMAPVVAVSGNTDDGLPCRETEVLSVDGCKLLVQHIVNPQRLEEGLERRLRLEAPDVVVFGHTHEPYCARRGGVLFINPGSAGRARWGKPRTLALLQWEGKPTEADVRFVELGP